MARRTQVVGDLTLGLIVQLDLEWGGGGECHGAVGSGGPVSCVISCRSGSHAILCARSLVYLIKYNLTLRQSIYPLAQ